MDAIVVKIRETFREEGYDLLAELEAALLELEKKPCDQELIARAFRAMHTIKGSGATCEFLDVASFTHDLETALDLVRKGKLAVSKELIDLALSARDHIKCMFDSHYSQGTVDEEKTKNLLLKIRKLISGITEKDKKAPAPPPSSPAPEYLVDGSGIDTIYRIRFKPHPNIFSQGINPSMLLNELRQLGTCWVVAQTDRIPILDELDSETCYTYWDVILTTNRGMNAIHDVFIFIRDDCELAVTTIHEAGALDGKVTNKKIGEILMERGDLSAEDLTNVLQAQKRVGQILVEKGLVSESKIQSALMEQQALKEIQEREDKQKKTESDASSSIRVATEKLDKLVNLVGELVTVQARLSQTSFSHAIPVFTSIAEEVERLTMDLRDTTMNIRMLPIGTTFSKFKRLVRNLSQELHKSIELTTDGADTELDKTVIDRLSDPLIHLIRNSIDHGIEKPEIREAAGKPRVGTIHLRATHVGATVQIQIRDDGKGLDPEVIRSKAMEKGLIAPSTELNEQEIFALILAPGFSTAQQITSVSGRGVGMDVVRKAIEDLHGTLSITSVKGAGTTITLVLPLTLAIIDGFLTRINSENFIFPLAAVEECVELTENDIKLFQGRQLTNVRGQIVPYIRLRQHFSLEGSRPPIEQIVIARVDNQPVGFAVDTIIGEHQTVLKSLGTLYRNVEGVTGATILGDGTLALILDIPKLVLVASREEAMLV
ncbi:MAG: chemotaxis protein CheA [Nitrospirota bacterium]